MGDRYAVPSGSRPRADGSASLPAGACPTVGSPDARLAPLAESLTARLGAVCRDWDAATFHALVQRIAETQLRWADRGDGR